MNIDDAPKLVPQTLYLFLSVMLTGESGQKDEDADDTTRRLSLNFGQDIVHAISTGKTLTPKHVGLEMNIHQATRSKTLVSLFHDAGHQVQSGTVRYSHVQSGTVTYSVLTQHSYSQVQRVDTTQLQSGTAC